MWDGNNYVRINGTDGSNVEREPMWDGNTAAQIYDRVLEGLSENQCGMETEILCRSCSTSLPVEREPMWDGNWLSYPP